MDKENQEVSVDESLPEHPPAELLDLFVQLDAEGVAPENMGDFASLLEAPNAN